jgi:hypothetical protein
MGNKSIVKNRTTALRGKSKKPRAPSWAITAESMNGLNQMKNFPENIIVFVGRDEGWDVVSE